MQKYINKLKKIWKEKKKVIIIGFIIIILIIILIVISTKSKNNLNKISITNQSMYQYLDNVKVTYDTTLTLENDNNITNMEVGENKTVIDNLPLYYTGEDMVLLPNRMSVIFPLSNLTQKIVPAFTILDGQSSLYRKLKYRDNTYDLENAFLFDGNDLYLFIEKTTLQIDDKEISLEPLSFVVYNNLTGYVTYYNYNMASDMVMVKDKISAKTNNYEINLKIDAIKSADDYKLLAKNLDILNNLF